VSKEAFQIEFDDESASATGRKNDQLSFEVSQEAHLSLELIDGTPFLFGNRSGFLDLVKILIKLGLVSIKTVSTFICAEISAMRASSQTR
jgi:hypothetical protein